MGQTTLKKTSMEMTILPTNFSLKILKPLLPAISFAWYRCDKSVYSRYYFNENEQQSGSNQEFSTFTARNWELSKDNLVSWMKAVSAVCRECRECRECRFWPSSVHARCQQHRSEPWRARLVTRSRKLFVVAFSFTFYKLKTARHTLFCDHFSWPRELSTA